MHDNRNVIIGLNRVEGQIRGVKKMVEDNRSCEEVLIQLSAVSRAVTVLSENVLSEHIRHCVVEGIKNGEEESTVDSLMNVLGQFLKMRK